MPTALGEEREDSRGVSFLVFPESYTKSKI